MPRYLLTAGVGPSTLITAPIHCPPSDLRPIGGNTSPASKESAASCSCACALVLAVYTRSVTDGSACPSRSATVFGFSPAAILGRRVVA